MKTESISISSVYATVGTRPVYVAAVARVWLAAVGTVDFSQSSGPPLMVLLWAEEWCVFLLRAQQAIPHSWV